MSPTTGRHEVLVVGGGPAGAATAYWLASAGHDVLVVEKKTFPREKTCGDGLTPRAVRQLHDMGLAERLADFHRFNGLRALAHGITLELEWPEHPDLPVVRIRRASPRPRPDGRRQRREGGRDGLAGRGGDRSGDRPWARARRDRQRPGGARRLRRHRRRRELDGSAVRSAPPATARTRKAWRSAATTRARCTRTPGSRARST